MNSSTYNHVESLLLSAVLILWTSYRYFYSISKLSRENQVSSTINTLKHVHPLFHGIFLSLILSLILRIIGSALWYSITQYPSNYGIELPSSPQNQTIVEITSNSTVFTADILGNASDGLLIAILYFVLTWFIRAQSSDKSHALDHSTPSSDKTAYGFSLCAGLLCSISLASVSALFKNVLPTKTDTADYNSRNYIIAFIACFELFIFSVGTSMLLMKLQRSYAGNVKYDTKKNDNEKKKTHFQKVTKSKLLVLLVSSFVLFASFLIVAITNLLDMNYSFTNYLSSVVKANSIYIDYFIVSEVMISSLFWLGWKRCGSFRRSSQSLDLPSPSDTERARGSQMKIGEPFTQIPRNVSFSPKLKNIPTVHTNSAQREFDKLQSQNQQRQASAVQKPPLQDSSTSFNNRNPASQQIHVYRQTNSSSPPVAPNSNLQYRQRLNSPPSRISTTITKPEFHFQQINLQDTSRQPAVFLPIQQPVPSLEKESKVVYVKSKAFLEENLEHETKTKITPSTKKEPNVPTFPILTYNSSDVSLDAADLSQTPILDIDDIESPPPLRVQKQIPVPPTRKKAIRKSIIVENIRHTINQPVIDDQDQDAVDPWNKQYFFKNTSDDSLSVGSKEDGGEMKQRLSMMIAKRNSFKPSRASKIPNEVGSWISDDQEEYW